MLDKTAYTAPLKMAPVRTLSGNSISKAKSWTARQRARFAAEWLAGVVQVEPTLKMAAEIFGASIPYVNEALADLKAYAEYVGNGCLINGNGTATPVSAIDAAWLSMDTDEREAFARRHLISLWDAIEVVTS
jgi:hypothetical protein